MHDLLDAINSTTSLSLPLCRCYYWRWCGDGGGKLCPPAVDDCLTASPRRSCRASQVIDTTTTLPPVAGQSPLRPRCRPFSSDRLQIMILFQWRRQRPRHAARPAASVSRDGGRALTPWRVRLMLQQLTTTSQQRRLTGNNRARD